MDDIALYLRPLDIRRAILGAFIRAGGGPLTIDEVLRRLGNEGIDLSGTQRTSAGQRVSDVMRHQVRVGHASSPVRGQFVLDLDEFSESTRYRCLHWRPIAERWNRQHVRQHVGQRER